ncbi:MAG: HD domain-containing protein [Lachnospiraceae bacterium]|nr:HD domain-containing protein [Lachnospiraceae bacterium]
MFIEFLREHQLDIMLVLVGINGMLIFFTLISKALSGRRRLTMIGLELSVEILLISDRFAYIYRGDTSDVGYWMVRVSNFLVFTLSLITLWTFTIYVSDLYLNEGGLDKIPRTLKSVHFLTAAGILLVIISQFTGLYYTFDDQNRYQRSPGMILCYIIPLVIMLLLMFTILKHRKRLKMLISIPLLLFAFVPFAASIVQIFLYGISFTNISMVGTVVVLYIFSFLDMNETVRHASELEIELLKKERKNMRLLFEQTAEALANAIDAKDAYTRGHSARVAEYSREIARRAGRREEEIDEVYFSALLHDVGKIGVPDSIITKDGRLTDEEYEAIKQHPVIGKQILTSISRSPYLSIGAHHHHERYDGKGYPDRLLGEDIPWIARIIAVADAYDAMTSKRSYRDTVPQHKVREEIVKGTGTQFDPVFAHIMLNMIDSDTDYHMKEQDKSAGVGGRTSLTCAKLRETISEGIQLMPDHPATVKFTTRAEGDHDYIHSIPTLIFYDSLDARVHDDEYVRKDLLYTEYATIRLDGKVEKISARKIETKVTETASLDPRDPADAIRSGIEYEISAVRIRDHLFVKISNAFGTTETAVALYDSTRYAYMAITGENCVINNIDIKESEEAVSQDSYTRIADEITYIDGPEGDIPNVQIDYWRSATSEAIPVTGDMRIRFHSMSLPTARLVWHCPFVSLFYSKNGKPDGEGFADYAVVRLDGEDWDSNDYAINTNSAVKTDEFGNWDKWKELNRAGLDWDVWITRKGNAVTVRTENAGIIIKFTSEAKTDPSDIYLALTGDQVAITNIRIERDINTPHTAS